jgi:hypothetical protein
MKAVVNAESKDQARARSENERRHAQSPTRRYVSPFPAEHWQLALETTNHFRKNWDASWKASVSKAPPF